MAQSNLASKTISKSKKTANLTLDYELHPKQAQCLFCPAQERLFGGARGGGKSLLARYEAIWWCTQLANFNCYLFRRLLPDLLKNHMEGAKGFRALLQPWVEKKLVQILEDEIRFLWNNSRIFLCHCQDEKDVYKYLSSEIHLLILEEATQFPESVVRFLRGSCRCVNLKIPAEKKNWFPRILYTSNPGGAGHHFFKQQFVDPAPPGKIWKAPPHEGGLTRVYIPSRLGDNPSMQRDDPGYAERLKGLGSPDLVKAYLDGDWGAVLGAFYPEFSPALHALKPFLIPQHWTRFMSYDWGSYDPFSIHWWAVASEEMEVSNTYGDRVIIPADSLIAYRNWYGGNGSQGLKLSLEKIASEIKRKEGDEEIQYRVLSVDCFRRRGGPSIADEFVDLGLHFRKADDNRVTGWQHLRNRLVGKNNRPTIYWFDTCRETIAQFPTFQHDPHKGEDMDGTNDHIAEDVRYAVMSNPFATETTSDETEDPFSHIYTINEILEHEERSKARAEEWE